MPVSTYGVLSCQGTGHKSLRTSVDAQKIAVQEDLSHEVSERPARAVVPSSFQCGAAPPQTSHEHPRTRVRVRHLLSDLNPEAKAHLAQRGTTLTLQTNAHLNLNPIQVEYLSNASPEPPCPRQWSRASAAPSALRRALPTYSLQYRIPIQPILSYHILS